jgi:hypothetical protein
VADFCIQATEQLVTQGTGSIVDIDLIESAEHELSMRLGAGLVLEVPFNSDIWVAGPGMGPGYFGPGDEKHHFQGHSDYAEMLSDRWLRVC